MAMESTAFRLDELTRKLLDRLAEIFSVSRGKLVRQALRGLGQLQVAAADDSYLVMGALVERYGPKAELVMGVRQTEKGPEGAVLIDGTVPEDVGVVPVVMEGTGYAYLFLVVADLPQRGPSFIQVGNDELLMVPQAHLSAGRLPWPSKEGHALMMSFDQLGSELNDELQKLAVGR
jgi:hypothetical protein